MIRKNNLFGLYIHIPFCVQKCRYCDFLSFPAGEDEKADYVTLLCEELEKRSTCFSDHSIATVYVGGGTPSCLSAEQMNHIFEKVKACYRLQEEAEVTVEVNPGTVEGEKLLAYRNMGINRLSIGLQSTHDSLLKTLGRIHTLEDFLHTYHGARKAGFDNISVDLMSALPGQNKEMLQNTLEQVIALQPEHISCYSLIVEEGTPFYRMRDQMGFPDEEEDREMYEMTGRMLTEAGYRRYEISNYAKEGKTSVHNSSYWKRVPYLGVGLGASSFIEEHRFSNPSSMPEYRQMVAAGLGTSVVQDSEDASRKSCGGDVCGIEKPQIWKMADPDTVTALSKEDCMEEFMFLGLRMMEGVSEAEFMDCFGESVDRVYGAVLSELVRDKLLVWEDGRIFLTEYGIDVSNYVFEKFLF